MKKTAPQQIPGTVSPRIKHIIGDPKANLPITGFLRLKQIIGDPKADPPIPPIIPVSRSSWWAGVKDGRYPAPVKLSARTTAWSAESIRDLIVGLGA